MRKLRSLGHPREPSRPEQIGLFLASLDQNAFFKIEEISSTPAISKDHECRARSLKNTALPL
jgi:hypothetical protein